MLLLKILLWILGIMIIICSFFFGEEETFSPTQENKENIYKSTHFTKLTNIIRNIYVILMLIFLTIAYFLT